VVAQGARVLIAAVTGVLVSRLLNPEGRGAYYVIVTIASTAVVLGHLSIEQANVALWSTAREAIPTNVLVLGPLLGLVSAVVTGTAVAILGPTVIPVSSYRLLVLALAAVPVAVTIVHLTNVALLLDRIRIVNRSALVGATVQCGALSGLALLGRLSVAIVIWIWTLSYVFPLVMLVAALRRYFRLGSVSLARQLVGTAIRYHLGLTALYLLLRVDVLILNRLAPGAPVGLYSLAVTVGELTRIGTDSVAQVILPRQAGHRIDQAAALTVRSTRVSVVVAGVLVVGLCMSAPLLIPLVYGTAFRGTVPAVLGLAPGLLILGATRSILPFLLRLRRPWVVSTISALALVVNVVANLFLIPVWGIVGCAIASTVGYAVYGGCQVAWFVKATRVSPWELVPGRAEARLLWSELRRLTRRSGPSTADR
jgi:O-antigen/teichoic acid export membrane protein